MSRRELILAVATAVGVLASSLTGLELRTSEDQRLTAIQHLAQALAECERRHTP